MLDGAVLSKLAWGCPLRALQTSGRLLPGSLEALVEIDPSFQGSVSAQQVRLCGGKLEPSNGMFCAVHTGMPHSGADGGLFPGYSPSGSEPTALRGACSTSILTSTTACAMGGNQHSCPPGLL